MKNVKVKIFYYDETIYEKMEDEINNFLKNVEYIDIKRFKNRSQSVMIIYKDLGIK